MYILDTELLRKAEEHAYEFVKQLKTLLSLDNVYLGVNYWKMSHLDKPFAAYDIWDGKSHISFENLEELVEWWNHKHTNILFRKS